MTEVVLLALLLLPFTAVYFFKSSGSGFFFTICASFVLVSLASDDIGNLLHRTNISQISSDSTNLILVFVPALLSLLLVRKQHSGQAQTAISWLAVLCGGALMVLITAPFMGSFLPADAYSSNVWTFLQNNQSWLITAGALSSLMLLWLKSSKKHKK